MEFRPASHLVTQLLGQLGQLGQLGACLPALGSLCYCRLGRCQMSDSVGSRVSFFVVGLGIGAIIGILFAPKSGEETRDYLSAKADEGRDYAQQKARELRERAEDLLERSKE